MALQEQNAVEIWKRIIETQMHFNEMSTKSRQLGLTLVVAALGLSAVLIGRGDDFSLIFHVCEIPIRIHVVVLVLLASALGMYGVKQLDLGVYHQMLRGAVKYGEEFEKVNLATPSGISGGMTEFVSLYSRYENGNTSGKQRLAGEKLSTFYWVTIIMICLLALSIFAVTQHGMTIERPATETSTGSSK